TYARTGIYVIGTKRGAHELLYEERLLVRAPGRGNATDRVPPTLALNAADFAGGIVDRLLPRYLAPFVRDALADHRLEDSIRMGRVSERKASFDTRVSVVGMAIPVRSHPDDLDVGALTLDLGLETATHAAVGTGCCNGALRLTEADQGLLGQCRRGA